MVVRDTLIILHDVKKKYDMVYGMCIEVTNYSRPEGQDPNIIVIQVKIGSSLNSNLAN